MRIALLAVAVVILAATPAQAAECHRWQLYTCERDNTAVVKNKHGDVTGYLQRQTNGTVQILDKHRNVRGYIENGKILDKHRRESLTIEGLPERYSPILE